MKKYHNYSLSFYRQNQVLGRVSSYANLGSASIKEHQKLLKPRSVDIFLHFSSQQKPKQRQMLLGNPQAHIDAFFDIIKVLPNQPQLMQFIIPSLDSILLYEPIVLRQAIDGIKSNRYGTILPTLKGILYKQQRPATYQSAARVLSILYGQLPPQKYLSQQKKFLLELIKLPSEGNKFKISLFALMTCLVHLIKIEELAQLYIEEEGGNQISHLFSIHITDVQIIYYVFLNVWMLSFHKFAIDNFFANPKYRIIRFMCQILTKINRQKLIRTSFATFKNLTEDKRCLECMIDNKLLKIVDSFIKGATKQDQILIKVKEIGSILENNMQVLSSFEKYCKEVNAGILEHSSVHTERFWKDNAIKCEINNFAIIHKLKDLIDSQVVDNQVLAIYDIGEFCNYYPNGRILVEQLKIKQMIIDKARYSKKKEVKQQALNTLQKIMIQNWKNL